MSPSSTELAWPLCPISPGTSASRSCTSTKNLQLRVDAEHSPGRIKGSTGSTRVYHHDVFRGGNRAWVAVVARPIIQAPSQTNGHSTNEARRATTSSESNPASAKHARMASVESNGVRIVYLEQAQLHWDSRGEIVIGEHRDKVTEANGTSELDTVRNESVMRGCHIVDETQRTSHRER